MWLCDFTGWFSTPNGDGKAGCLMVGCGRYLVVRFCTVSPFVTIRFLGLNDQLPAL